MEIKKQDLIDICRFCYEAGFKDGFDVADDFYEDATLEELIKKLNNGGYSYITPNRDSGVKPKLIKYRITEVLKIFHLEHILED